MIFYYKYQLLRNFYRFIFVARWIESLKTVNSIFCVFIVVSFSETNAQTDRFVGAKCTVRGIHSQNKTTF